MTSLSRVLLFATPWTVAYQAPLSMEFSRQEYWSGVPLPSPSRVYSLHKLLEVSSFPQTEEPIIEYQNLALHGAALEVIDLTSLPCMRTSLTAFLWRVLTTVRTLRDEKLTLSCEVGNDKADT